MNKRMLVLLVILCSSLQSPAQTFAEFFRQNKTQKKYLLEQIAALRVYGGFVEQGYRIAGSGLDAIGVFSGREGKDHQNFISSLTLIAPFLNQPSHLDTILQSVRRLKNIAGHLAAGPGSPHSRYIRAVKTALLKGCAEELENYLETMHAGQLEMTDRERLERINAISQSIKEKVVFAHRFLEAVSQLEKNVSHEIQNLQHLKTQYEIPD